MNIGIYLSFLEGFSHSHTCSNKMSQLSKKPPEGSMCEGLPADIVGRLFPASLHTIPRHNQLLSPPPHVSHYNNPPPVTD